MSKTVKDKIIERMALQNISIAELERRAGLTIHSVRNLIKGRIKRPSLNSLEAIAMGLGCSIADLLGSEPGSEPGSGHVPDTDFVQHKQKLNPSIKHPELLLGAAKKVLDLMGVHGIHLSLDEFLEMVRKVYVYSTKGESKTVDQNFAEWLMETQVYYKDLDAGLRDQAVG